jgi:hypothetical protein
MRMVIGFVIAFSNAYALPMNAELRGKRAPMSTLEHDPKKLVLGLDPITV